MFPTTDSLLIFTVNGIKNPPYYGDYQVVAQSIDNTGKLLEQSGPTAINFSTQPGSLTTVITNLGSDVVGDMTDIKLEFTV